MLTPHLLNSHRHFAVPLISVVQNLCDREALAIGIASVSQQLTGSFWVKAQADRRVVAASVGRRHGIGGDLARFKHMLSQLFAVNGHAQRATDPLILQVRLTNIDTVIIGAQIRNNLQCRIIRISIGLNLVDWHIIGVVQLFRAEHALFSGDVFCGIEHNTIEFYLIIAMEKGISLNLNSSVNFPGLEFKWAIAYEVALISPAGSALISATKLLDSGLMDWVHAVVIQQLQEVGRWVFQGNLQCQIIEGLYTHLLKICYLAFVEFVGINNREIHIGIEVTQSWLQGTRPGPDKVMGIVHIAIGPASIVTQLEGVDTAVVADSPGFGNAGLWLQSLAVFVHQAFHKRHNNMMLGNASGNMGV